MTTGPSDCTNGSPASGTDYKTYLIQKLPALQANETMSAYCKRVGKVLDHKDCHVVPTMGQPGLYLFKRPVHSSGSNNGGGISAESLLKQAGSIMHHIILYVKTEDELSALEMGPEGSADTHDNLFEAVEAGPVHQSTTIEPIGPFLHVDVPTHPLSHPEIQQAITFAQGRKYHTLRGNCIQFADAMVRLLTGGAVFGAPLAYDAKAGSVPPVDSPLLPMLSMTMQLSWLDVCDGAGFLADLLAVHNPPPQLAASLQLHTPLALPQSESSSKTSTISPLDIFSLLQQGSGSTAPQLDIASLLSALQPQPGSGFGVGTTDVPVRRTGKSSSTPADTPVVPRQSKGSQGYKKGFLN